MGIAIVCVQFPETLGPILRDPEHLLGLQPRLHGHDDDGFILVIWSGELPPTVVGCRSSENEPATQEERFRFSSSPAYRSIHRH